MESVTTKPVEQVSMSDRVRNWLTSGNFFITSLMEGEVITNAKLLSAVQVGLACYFLLRSLSVGYASMGACLVWLFLALILCKKVK